MRFSGVLARDCPVDMEWTECMSTCGSTCESLSTLGSKVSCAQTAADCLPGCQCREGTVFDRSVGYEGSCVEPTECSCRHRGTVYPPQSTVTVDCNEWFVSIHAFLTQTCYEADDGRLSTIIYSLTLDLMSVNKRQSSG